MRTHVAAPAGLLLGALVLVGVLVGVLVFFLESRVRPVGQGARA